MKKLAILATSLVLITITSVLLVGAQQTHSVTLNWGASTVTGSTVVSKYNIYRSATPGGEVAGTPLASTANGSALTYTDTTVAGGQTYYYTITGFCQICSAGKQESAMSNEFKAAIPADQVGPPGSPSGLTGTIQ